MVYTPGTKEFLVIVFELFIKRTEMYMFMTLDISQKVKDMYFATSLIMGK
jgi:hypothetical protein